MKKVFFSLSASTALLFGQTPAPQQPQWAETKLLGMGSHLLQGKHPIDQIDAYVCGLHFYLEKSASRLTLLRHDGEAARERLRHHLSSYYSFKLNAE
jgi:hypothetical protein